MPTNDSPEGAISNELKRLWALGYSPFEIHRKTKIPLEEIYRRLKKEVQQPLVERGKVIQ